jgi:hypothetical protein
MAYTKEQQTKDVILLDYTIGSLSGRVEGEKQDFCISHIDDYIRIARFWGHAKLGKEENILKFKLMLTDLCCNEKVPGFKVEAYDKLLRDTRRLVKQMIFRRKKAPETCLRPESHIPKCYCGNMAAAMVKREVL